MSKIVFLDMYNSIVPIMNDNAIKTINIPELNLVSVSLSLISLSLLLLLLTDNVGSHVEGRAVGAVFPTIWDMGDAVGRFVSPTVPSSSSSTTEIQSFCKNTSCKY